RATLVVRAGSRAQGSEFSRDVTRAARSDHVAMPPASAMNSRRLIPPPSPAAAIVAAQTGTPEGGLLRSSLRRSRTLRSAVGQSRKTGRAEHSSGLARQADVAAPRLSPQTRQRR